MFRCYPRCHEDADTFPGMGAVTLRPDPRAVRELRLRHADAYLDSKLAALDARPSTPVATTLAATTESGSHSWRLRAAPNKLPLPFAVCQRAVRIDFTVRASTVTCHSSQQLAPAFGKPTGVAPPRCMRIFLYALRMRLAASATARSSRAGGSTGGLRRRRNSRAIWSKCFEHETRRHPKTPQRTPCYSARR